MSAYRERMLALLGDRSPAESLDATRKRIEELVEQLGEEGLSRSYGPGKWRAREILVHLADAELAIGFRMRQALAEQNHTVQAFDQDDWARRYAPLDARLAARTFGAVRLWNLALIRTLSPEDLARPVMHPERGIESVGIMIRMLAGHDLNHLAQLEQIAGQKKQTATIDSQGR
jgi:DinB superfamily